MITLCFWYCLLDLEPSMVMEGCHFLDVSWTLLAKEGGLEMGSLLVL